MRKLFAQIHVSVDGYFDGPDQELDWFVLDDEFFAYVEEMLGRSADPPRPHHL